MNVIIQDRDSGLFWTGDRWSEHIAEALAFTRTDAIAERRYLRERMDLKLKLMRLPAALGGDES